MINWYNDLFPRKYKQMFYWTPGHGEKGPINYGLSILPSVLSSIFPSALPSVFPSPLKFLEFTDVWYGTKGLCGLCVTAPDILGKSPLSKNNQKWSKMVRKRGFCHQLLLEMLLNRTWYWCKPLIWSYSWKDSLPIIFLYQWLFVSGQTTRTSDLKIFTRCGWQYSGISTA